MIRLNESGREIRILTNFDMSLNTGLVMRFTPPKGSSGTAFSLSSPDVTAPSVDTDPLPSDNNFSGGVMPANHYMQYTTNGTEFDVSGEWLVCVEYQNSASIPSDIYSSGDSVYAVLGACS